MTTTEEGNFAVRADGYFVTYSSTPNEQHDTHHLLGLIPSGGFGKEQNAMAGGTTGARRARDCAATLAADSRRAVPALDDA
eukprot:2862747-Pleurochrysis_carterae.AAC.1